MRVKSMEQGNSQKNESTFPGLLYSFSKMCVHFLIKMLSLQQTAFLGSIDDTSVVLRHGKSLELLSLHGNRVHMFVPPKIQHFHQNKI